MDQSSSLTLRPYQQKAVDSVRDHLMTKATNPCVVLPTGTGKSVVLGEIANLAVNRGGSRVLVLAHVKELLEQNASLLRELGFEFAPITPTTLPVLYNYQYD